MTYHIITQSQPSTEVRKQHADDALKGLHAFGAAVLLVLAFLGLALAVQTAWLDHSAAQIERADQ